MGLRHKSITQLRGTDQKSYEQKGNVTDGENHCLDYRKIFKSNIDANSQRSEIKYIRQECDGCSLRG